MVGTGGFEPSASCSQSKRSTRLSYVPSLATTDKITALFYFASVFLQKYRLSVHAPILLKSPAKTSNSHNHIY